MADRYWVGGTGNWNDTAKWSILSGSVGGASVPTAADNAYFDGSSDTGAAFTVTVNAASTCNDLIIGGVVVTALDQIMTLAGSFGLTVSGSLFFPVTNLTRTYTGLLTFNATTTGKTITTNGVSLVSTEFSGVGGEWTLGSAFNSTTLTITNGTFNTSAASNYSLTTTTIGLGIGTKTVTLNSSVVTVQTFNVATNGTGLTLNVASAAIQISPGGGIVATGQTFGTVTYVISTGAATSGYITNAVASNIAITGSYVSMIFYFAGVVTVTNTFSFVGNLSSTTTFVYTGTPTVSFANITANPEVGNGKSSFIIPADLTCSGTLSVRAANTSPSSRIAIASSVRGTARTITAATKSFGTGIDFQDITAAGASAPWDISALSGGDLKGNTNITFTTPKTVYWNLTGSQNWSATAWATTPTGTPATANFPLAQDTAVITEAGSAGTITINSTWDIGTLTFDNGVSPRTSVATLNVTSAPTFYGDLKLSSGVILSGTSVVTFAGRNTQTITSAAKTFTCGLTVDSLGGTLLLNGSLSLANNQASTLTRGTLDLNGFILNTGIFNSNNTNARSIAFGNSKIQVSYGGDTNGAPFNMSDATNFTYTGVSNIEFTYVGSVGVRFIGSHSGGTALESNVLNMTVIGGSDRVHFPSGASNINQTLRSLTFLSAFSGIFGGNGLGGSAANSYPPSFFGDLTLSANTSLIDFNVIRAMYFLSNTVAQNINTNGKILNCILYFQTAGTGNVVLAANCATTAGCTHVSGTVNLNGKVLTAPAWGSNNSNIRTLNFGTGQIEVNGTGDVWNISNVNYTINPGTGKIVLSNNTTTARSFNGGSLLTYPELEIGGDTSTSTTTITGDNGFTKLSSTKTVSHTIVFPNSDTRVANWNLNGSAGNLVTLSRTGASGAFTIRYTGGSYALGRYLSISNSTALPVKRLYAIYSTNGGGNTNWTFDTPKFGQFLSFFASPI